MRLTEQPERVSNLVSDVSWRQKALGYWALTKPRVIELLLVSTVPTMILAERGIPDMWLMVATVLGGAMSAGSAGAFNSYIDRATDRVMTRTAARPLVTGVLTGREALVFATLLGIASVVFLWFTTNPLAALLSLTGLLLYAVFYSIVLKRRTSQNIIWGGAAGTLPVFVGWAAVTGTVEATAWVLALIVFLWTPPHYWPLSMRYKDDYTAAGIPMLGAIKPDVEVGLQVVIYAWITVAASMLLIPVAPMGWLYAVVAAASGAWFLYESHRLYRGAVRGETPSPMRVFHGSIGYLTVLFVAIAIDPLLL